MDGQFEIKFGKSTSIFYNDALRIAKKFSNFSPISEDNNLNIIKANTTEMLNKYKTFDALLKIIYGWRSREILFNGDCIEPYNFFRSYKEIIFCSKKQAVSVKKDTYCYCDYRKVGDRKREGWSCRFLIYIKRHKDQGNDYLYNKYWYEFGDFENDNKEWKINKPLLKETLLEEVKEKVIEQCPIFSVSKLDQIINRLPDKLDLTKNDTWEIEYEEDFLGESIEKKPIGIRHKGINDSWESIISLRSNGSDDDDGEEDSIRTRNIPKVTFDDIGGIEDIIERIREVVELPLKKPELFKHLGIKPHKGILLYGLPGNGKTMVAKAIANEVKAHFIPISGSELLSKWYGESEENLRNTFKEAKEFQPTIIFFDEIDSIAQKRSGGENLRHDSRFVTQLLALMDGMETYDNVSVLASTNRPELLDAALLRPGRFDYKIEIKKPNLEGCFKILTIATKKMPLDNVDLKEFSQKLLGLSGAEIVFVVKEAAYNSLRRNLDLKSIITSNDDDILNEDNILVTIDDLKTALEEVKKKDFEKK